MAAITTKATYVAPAVFNSGSLAHFSVAADLRVAADLKVFVEVISALCNVIILGTPSDTAMRFAVENNGVTFAQMNSALATAGVSGTVSAFAY